MPTDATPGKPSTRRYSPEEKAAAVRMVRTLRAELGTEHGTVQRVSPGCVGRNCLPCHRPAHLTRRRVNHRCISAPPGAW